MALSGHAAQYSECLLSGVKRTTADAGRLHKGDLHA